MGLGDEIGSATQSAAKLCVVVVTSSEVLLELMDVSVGSIGSVVGSMAAPTCSGVVPVMPWTNCSTSCWGTGCVICGSGSSSVSRPACRVGQKCRVPCCSANILF